MFVHLHVHSPYSFLDGASDIETLVRRAASFGMPALALTDHDSVAAAVKFVTCCQQYSILPILGAEVTMEDGSHLTLLSENRIGYANLCRLLTQSYAHGGRLTPRLPWNALSKNSTGLFCLSGCRRGSVSAHVRDHKYDQAREVATRLKDWFGSERFYIELQDDLTPGSHRVCLDLVELAAHLGVSTVATNNVHHSERADYITWDVLRTISTGTTSEQVHPQRPFNSERYLKSPQIMSSLFAWCPEAVENTLRIADQCEVALPIGEEITPRFSIPEAHGDAGAYLRHLTYKGARSRYKVLVPKIVSRLEHELDVICTLGFADYMLLCWDIVRWARKEGIRATGRGSAADSCVAYSLYLTDVDVIERRLPFARFLVPGKTPDVDVDFPSDRRDDVFRHIIEKYGEDHVGMCCTFHTYWARSAVRDVGKAMNLPKDSLEILSDRLSGFVRADQIEDAFERYAELRPFQKYKERFRLLFLLCSRIAGFPRHIGTHSSGVVISRVPLSTIAPLQPSARGLTQIWTLDKDDAEAVGGIKFDVLSLRALSAVGDAEMDIARADPTFRYDRIPLTDSATYNMIQSGKAVGSFQLESAAQMSLATTLDPTTFEHLVASVALIRPGPIRGNAVRRYVSARNGWSRTDVLHPCLAPLLAKTYGVIVFQEQVNDVFAAMTGCSDAQADALRKALTKHATMGTMDQAREDFVSRARARHPDLSPERAHLLFDQIEGWSGLGFIEGHAAAFALTGYKTSYLSVHYAAEFYSGLLNHLPMGYFNANSYAAEARRRGVQILPVDINMSGDKSYAERPDAIRLGLRLVAEMREQDVAAIVQERAKNIFRSLLEFCVRVPLPKNVVEHLVLCGTFDGLHSQRRGLVWRLDETLALANTLRAEASGSKQQSFAFGDASQVATPVAEDIEEFSPWEAYMWTWRITGVCADCHPMAHTREYLKRWRILTTQEAEQQKHGARVTVAGINIRPHRPPTRSGRSVLFSTLEDEMGFIQTVCIGDALEACTPVFLLSPVVIVRGVIERHGTGASLRVEKVKPFHLSEGVRQIEGLHGREAPVEAREEIAGPMGHGRTT
ncbi:MAG: polymerase alpha subunit [Chthonomonadaceae bacterium]|nr:polymerase alpha subunit [Chthonomonadaceae bacterium]